ncbi:zinc finger, PHD-type containing protein [Tanacetum coccineum]
MLNHPSHTHSLRQGYYPYGSWACDYCQSQHKIDEVGYSCVKDCYFYFDVNCVMDVEKKSIHHPSHPHKLVCAISTPILCHCKACGREHKGIFYTCTTCVFTIHSDCAFLPKKLLIQKTTDDAFYHPHPLTISYSFPIPDQKAKYYPRCRVCNDYFYDKTSLWLYKCEKCMYYAHVDCATSRREPFMSILSSTGSGILVKNYEDADYPDILHLPFPDQTRSILKHLFFKKNGPRTFETDECETDTHSIWGINSIYKFVNVKFGDIHKTPGHPHPLCFTRGTTSDGHSRMCGNRLRFQMIFTCLECKYAIDYECCKNFEQIMKVSVSSPHSWSLGNRRRSVY